MPHLLGAVNMISTFEIEERCRDRVMKAAVHRNRTMICPPPKSALKLSVGRHQMIVHFQMQTGRDRSGIGSGNGRTVSIVGGPGRL